MKKTLILLTMAFGFNSFALNCTSTNLTAQSLKITKVAFNMVHAEAFIRTYEDIYVGTVNSEDFFTEVYTLFNQLGEKATFTVKKKISLAHHCRARICDDEPTGFKPSTGKLVIEGLEDEYFTCI